MKGRHTPEFIAGYINGSQNYENNRGYVDGNNKVPKSSHNADYIQGYNQAAVQDRELFGGLDKVRVGHDPHEFYLGMYNGIQFTDDRYAADNESVNGTVNSLHGSHRVNGRWTCPSHNKSFCSGWQFGRQVEDDERDGM